MRSSSADLQVGHVARDLRANVGVDDGGLGALVFLHLRHHVAGHGDRRIAEHLTGDLGRAALVRRVDVGIDEADGQRLDAAAGVQGFEVRAQRCLVQRRHHLPVGADTLFRTDGQLQRCQQRTLDEGHPAAEPTGAE
jgi:hypothetical protein